MSIETIHQLSEKRKKWVETTRENDFEDGIKRFLTDLYPDNAHFIYELLQNAEDTKASEVQFVLNTDSIEFEHNGSQLFSISDVESITSIGNSPKKDDPTSIGKFGVGFKAVFAYTSTPEIKSGEYHFRIRDLVVPDTEGLFPRTLDENRTHFFFPFNNPQKPAEKACAEIEKSLRQLDEGALLFLKNIRKIEYRLPDSKSGSLERMEKDEDRIEISVRRPKSIVPDSVHYLRFEKMVEVWDEDEGKRKPCRIAVAFGMERGKAQKWKIKQLDKGQVCIYFPAENEPSNLRFHLHAPFASTVARNSIRKCLANDELRDHLADLVAESMFAIRDQGLLDVAFLAVLPNDGDNRSSFNQPIQEKLVEVFKNEKLTPMKRGGHAAASEIYQGDTQLSDLISDKDLATILGKNRSLPLWAANDPQNQWEDNFLSLLEIDEWDEKDLVNELSNQPNLVMRWIKKKSYKWHQEFYALLGDFCTCPPYASEYSKSKYRDRKDELSNLPIVLLSDGATYKKGKGCYFPSDDIEHDEKFPRVAKGVYSSGKNEDQKKKARKFLKEIDVSDVGEVHQVEAILKQRYVKGTINLREQHHEEDLKRFIALIDDMDTPNQANLFKDYFIFELDSEHWGMPCDHVFVDRPYLDTGLRAYYEALDKNSNRKRALSPKYEKYGIALEKIGKFAKIVGAQTELKIEEQEIPFFHPDRDHLFNAQGERKRNEKNIDYTIPAFRVLFDKPNLDKARLIWRRMDSLSSIYLTAKYRKNEKGGFNYADSSLVYELREAKWVPQEHGESLDFVRPCDASRELLPEDFLYNSRHGWISKVEFGENVRKKSEEYKKREKLLSSLPIEKEIFDFASELSPEEQKEMMEDYKRKRASKRDQSTQQRNILFHRALRESFVEPDKIAIEEGIGYGGSVQNPSRRRARTSADIAADIENEGKQGARSYFATVKKWKGKNDQVRVNLTEWYGGQCQICDKTFTQRNGEPYFEGLYLVSYTNAEWIDRVGNVLCLCPWHSTMFQFGPKEVDEDIIQQILRLKVQSEGGEGQLAIKLRLCEEDVEIKFEESHLIDLQEMIKKSQDLEHPVP